MLLQSCSGNTEQEISNENSAFNSDNFSGTWVTPPEYTTSERAVLQLTPTDSNDNLGDAISFTGNLTYRDLTVSGNENGLVGISGRLSVSGSPSGDRLLVEFRTDEQQSMGRALISYADQQLHIQLTTDSPRTALPRIFVLQRNE
ncbi:MAG: hypothetical protein LAT67_05395 [Balneolales bacterium]|nr:hypothetical protein [Balneolales bacterium]